MNTATGNLTSLIESEIASLTELRQEFHAHPELRFEETRTASRVSEELTRLGIAHATGLGGVEAGKGTGVLAHLPATVDSPGACVGLRADMDALPIVENTGKAYASTNPGVMHACGHDGHTTILLGAARVLSQMERPNPVTLVFQPAEEGGAGGEKMCRDGALIGGPDGSLGPAVSKMFGLHGWPGLPLGTVGTKPGPLLAATDEIEVRIRGTQAHAAYPHLGSDPIVAGAHIVTAAQTLVSRSTSPLDALVVTFGMFNAGSAINVIPGEAVLRGTIRTLTPEVRSETVERLGELCRSIARGFGCEAELIRTEGYPCTNNDPEEAVRVLETAKEAAFARDAVVVPEPSMGGEDFAYYALEVPSCFYLIGLHPEKDAASPVPQLHQAEFDFNDGAIGLGVEMMCRLAVR